MALFDGLEARYCPSLDSSGDGTDTLHQLDAAGDVVSGGYHATLVNLTPGDAWVTNVDNGGSRAIEFIGDATDQIEIPKELPFLNLGSDDFSMMFWAKWDGVASFNILLRAFGDSYNQQFWGYQVNNGASSFGFTDANTGDGGAVGGAAPSGGPTEWNNMLLVRSGGTLKQYSNGVFQSEDIITGSYNFNFTNPIIGNYGNIFGSGMLIDDYCFFSEDKSSDAAELYSSGRGFTTEGSSSEPESASENQSNIFLRVRNL